MPRPTTQKDLMTAIYESLTTLSDDVAVLKSDMVVVKDQVKYTNGKVAGLIEKDIRREEREKTLAEIQKPIVEKAGTVVVNPKFWQTEAGQRMITALAVILSVVGSALAIAMGVNQ